LLEGEASVRGVEVSIILSSEQVGGCVGESISEPLLSAGILASVFGYMIYLQPIMALAQISRENSV
jgi:hypothetical protein